MLFDRSRYRSTLTFRLSTVLFSLSKIRCRCRANLLSSSSCWSFCSISRTKQSSGGKPTSPATCRSLLTEPLCSKCFVLQRLFRPRLSDGGCSPMMFSTELQVLFCTLINSLLFRYFSCFFPDGLMGTPSALLSGSDALTPMSLLLSIFGPRLRQDLSMNVFTFRSGTSDTRVFMEVTFDLASGSAALSSVVKACESLFFSIPLPSFVSLMEGKKSSSGRGSPVVSSGRWSSCICGCSLVQVLELVMSGTITSSPGSVAKDVRVALDRVFLIWRSWNICSHFFSILGLAS